MPRTKPAADRRGDLLDAAEKVFVAKGVGAATVADVTAAAGVAKGTFYLYFESKEQLIEALQERFMADQLRLLVGYEALPPAAWPGLIADVAERVVRVYFEHGDLHEVLFHHGGPHPPVAHVIAEHANEQTVTDLAAWLRRGSEAGVFSVEDPEVSAMLLFGAVCGAICGCLHTDGAVPDVERVVRAVRELVARTVVAPAPSLQTD